MTNEAKQGVCECIWGAEEEGEFDMPKRNELYNDDGIISLFNDEDPLGPPTGRIASVNGEGSAVNLRLAEQLRVDRRRIFSEQRRPHPLTATGVIYSDINI
jgi:hypothetical protein